MNRSMQILFGIAAAGALGLSGLASLKLPEQGAGAEVPKTDTPAPALSKIPFHMEFISAEMCLQCHNQARQIKLQGEIMEAPGIPHENRDRCVQCHRLPGAV